MPILLLGPLEVHRRGRAVALGGPRQRAVLAALALRANETVGVDYLADTAWERPPASLRANLRTYITNLRRVLGDDDIRLLSTSGGYRLVVDAGERDVDLFEDFADRGARAQRHGASAQAVDWYDRALAVWRGRSPLVGLPADTGLETFATRLRERWFHVAERRAETWLRIGAYGNVVDQLRPLVVESPMRESLSEMLMLALYQSGRPAEALEVFRRARESAVDALGIEPGPRLRELQHAILNSDPVVPPAGAAGTARPTPFELPAATRGFRGRQPQLSQLDALLDRATTGPAVAVVTGMAGVGKTALATQWAHTVADWFPDGQIFVEMGGYGVDEPVGGHVALEHVLRSLGMPPDRIPTDDGARRAAYRSVLAGRRFLLVLDNVRAADQIRPLLPASAGCMVVATSRDTMVGPAASDGAHTIEVDPLAEREAVALLRDRLGEDRVQAEPDALADLARLCAHLPLALRIAAARLAARPRHTVEALVRRIEKDTLGVLHCAGDPPAAVRAAFDHSYVLLDEPTRRLFRWLSLMPGNDYGTGACAALIDTPVESAEELLETLICAHLLEEYRPGRFRQHDLLRQYAAHLAATEDDERDRHAAVRRSIGWYLTTAAQATRVLDPHRRRDLPVDSASAEPFTGHDEALAWCEAELRNVVAAVSQATEHDLHDLAWQLPVALFGFLELRKHWADWSATHEIGLASARRVGNRHAQAWLLNSLGIAAKQSGRFDHAVDRYRAALSIRQAIGDRHGEAVTLNNLGTLANRSGDAGAAIEHYTRALTLFRETGDRWGEGLTLTNLGESHRARHAFEPAMDCFVEALGIRQDLGDRRGEGIVLNNIANTEHALGRPAHAIDRYRQALRIRHSTGDRWGVARTLTNLGTVLREMGRPVAARRCWRWALEIFHNLGDRQADDVRALLGDDTPTSVIRVNRDSPSG